MVRDEQLYEKSIEVEQKTKQIGLERITAEQILTAHFPVAWDKAKAAMAEITLEDCEAEIINMAVVPEAVQTIFECVLVLRGGPIEKMAGGSSNRVTGILYQLLQTVLTYGDALREVRPKRERIEYLEQELDSQIKVLAKINEDAVLLNAELQRYHAQHMDAIAQQQILNEMLEQAEMRVATSQQLMQRFEERDLWLEQLESLEEHACLIPGDCLLGAAFLSYCGPFPHSVRSHLVQLEDINRRGIPHSCPFDVKTLLGDERQINWWFLHSLPQRDEFFVQNALLVENVVHFPLIIDPHKLAVTWLRSQAVHGSCGNHELVETYLMDGSFGEKLEVAMEQGQWILFNDVHEVIDPFVVALFKDWQSDRGIVMWRGRPGVELNMQSQGAKEWEEAT